MADVVPLVPGPAGEHGGPPAPVADPREPDSLAEAVVRAALGAVALTLGTAASIVRSAADLPEATGEEGDRASLLAGAALGLATEALRTAGALAAAMGRVLSPVAEAGMAAAEPARRSADAVLHRWDSAWRDERPGAEALAGAVANEATRRAVAAIAERIDLTQLAVDHIDIDRLAAGVDVDAVAARIDLDGLVGRLDVDSVADRIDVERIVARLDLPAMALDVVERIDLPEIIRASTSAVGSETVRSVRMDAVAADDAVSRLMDRLLRRRAPQER